MLPVNLALPMFPVVNYGSLFYVTREPELDRELSKKILNFTGWRETPRGGESPFEPFRFNSYHFARVAPGNLGILGQIGRDLVEFCHESHTCS